MYSKSSSDVSNQIGSFNNTYIEKNCKYKKLFICI